MSTSVASGVRTVRNALPRLAGVAVITALGDVHSPGRIAARAVRLTVSVLLVHWLWSALYRGTAQSAGLTRTQALAFAILSVLITQINETDRWIARDTVYQHVGSGTIIYWFLRPMAARRYCLVRAVGDRCYGLARAAVVYVVCLAVGLLTAPASSSAAAAFAVTALLGQVVVYQLGLLVDQMCFWMVKNGAVVAILEFVQALLSGALAPLWFFPQWFQLFSSLMPFQATLNVPLSFYTGRMPVQELPEQIALQLAWIAVLTTLTRLLWRNASDKIQSQGG
ncbi:ABC transporter permease [Kitasatospora terrestris]|uniref:ABC transporter permease n=1 Tax=Kitasatospora terrestris TaxID=258051 RepID=A0ABP9DG62_9ACTN